jgi:hypothetical protein
LEAAAEGTESSSPNNDMAPLSKVFIPIYLQTKYSYWVYRRRLAISMKTENRWELHYAWKLHGLV